MLTPPVVMRRPEYPHPKATLAPGRVVWARVEGHEWWPAKIVRRRAVPREVCTPCLAMNRALQAGSRLLK